MSTTLIPSRLLPLTHRHSLISTFLSSSTRLLSHATSRPISRMSSSPSLVSSVHQVILATFAADSLSLSAHWEYNTDNITKAYPSKVDHLAAPLSSYHSGKAAGDQTHIGDNALLLLSHLAHSPNHTLDIPSYLTAWQAAWDVPTPPGYVDHATKTLLQSIKEGKTGGEAASTDDDLSHSSKFFPLLASPAYQKDEEALVKATQSLVSTFQKGKEEQVSGEFLARVAFRVIAGKQRPTAAIDAVVAQLNDPWLTDRVQVGKASASEGDVEALRSFGEKKEFPGGKVIYLGYTCGVKVGIPAVVHFVFKYEDATDPTQALIEDVSVGGNSNARSMAVAVLLFGYRGVKGFKIEELIKGIKQREKIEELLKTIEKSQA